MYVIFIWLLCFPFYIKELLSRELLNPYHCSKHFRSVFSKTEGFYLVFMKCDRNEKCCTSLPGLKNDSLEIRNEIMSLN